MTISLNVLKALSLSLYGIQKYLALIPGMEKLRRGQKQ
jgi:hypothetical protein